MMSIRFFLSVMFLFAAQLAWAQPEFAVTRQGNEFLFDYIPGPDSKITALGFRVDIGDVDPESIDLSNCASNIEPPHMGFCKANPGFVKVLVYSNDPNVALPVSHIGSIRLMSQPLRGSAHRRDGLRDGASRSLSRESVEFSDPIIQIKVEDLVYSDFDANDIPGEVLQ